MKPSRFVIQYYMLTLSLLLMAMPFYHRATARGMQTALKTNLDFMAGMAGLLGFGVAITILNRRLAALEKLLAAKNLQS